MNNGQQAQIMELMENNTELQTNTQSALGNLRALLALILTP